MRGGFFFSASWMGGVVGKVCVMEKEEEKGKQENKDGSRYYLFLRATCVLNWVS